MKQKSILWLSLLMVFSITFHSCIHDDSYSSASSSPTEYQSKSFWKEDEKYIKNVMKIYSEHESEIKKIDGILVWNYAMSMGKYDESFMVVPIIENNRVVNTLVCARFEKKVYFKYDNTQSNIKFFNDILFGKYTQVKTDQSSGKEKSSSQKGSICVTQGVSMWYPNSESNPNAGGHWETNYYTNCYSYQDYYVPGWETGGSGGFDYGGWGGTGSTVDPNNPQSLTPCEQTKSVYNNTAVKSRYDILKGKTSGPNESGYGFKTVSDGNGGTTTQTNPLNPDTTDPDKMHVGIYPTSYGYIHTHLDKTDGTMAVKIFSPADINTFLAFLHNAQANGTPLGSIFGGMIATDPDTSYNIYQIQYVGNGNDLPAEYSDEQVKSFKRDYIKMAQEMVNQNGEGLTHSDMQKLFSQMLKKMNIINVVLSKIEGSNTIKKVNFDTNGNPTEENCPQT